MGSKKDRCPNVIDQPLGPNWRILRWRRVTIRKQIMDEYGARTVDRNFLFKKETVANRFVAAAKSKHPNWNVWACDVYVLSGNNGETAYELPGYSPKKPRTSARLRI